MEPKHKHKLLEIEVLYIFATAVLILVIMYMIFRRFITLPAFRLPSVCLFHDLLHLYCPGCGGTRAVNALLTFHFLQSFLANPIVLYGTGLIAYYYIAETITLIMHNGKQYLKFHDWQLYVGLGIIVVFFIGRNLLLVFCKVDYLGDLIQYWT